MNREIQPYRVLHVTECFGGGVARAIGTIVELMPEVQHHLIWRGDEIPDESVFESVIPMPKSLPLAVRCIRGVTSELHPNVLHAHSSWAGVYSRLLPIESPIIYEPHCFKFDDPSHPALLRHGYRVAERILTKRTSVLAVLSPHEQALARSLNSSTPLVNITNVASSVPSANYPTSAYRESNLVIMIGRLSKQKDPYFFEAVANQVREVAPDVRFRWIGDGDREIRRRLERGGIEVTGWLNQGELMSELGRPSLYFHCAEYEGFPLSVLDAAAFEHPIVARSIAAFNGLGIPSAKSVMGNAELVVAALQDSELRNQAIAVSKALNRRRNNDRLRWELQELYRRFD